MLTRRLFFTGAGLAAFACFGKVKTQANPKSDFSRYKTYQWYPTRVLKKSGVSENDEVIAPVIKAAVDREMVRRGFTEVPSGGDIKIQAWALSESVPRVDALIYAGGGMQGAGSFYDPVTAPVASIGGYSSKEGTLVVNLIDSSANASAWAAKATGSYKDMSKINAKIDKMVTDMFKKYPVAPR